MIEISVVIPTYGRAAALRGCLEALAVSDFPPDEFEVVVVDDGSPEPVEPQLCNFDRISNLVVIRQPRGGPGAARNRGVSQARGAYLAFTDDDCLPERGWLRAIHQRLLAGGRRAVGGRTVNAVPGDVNASVHHLLGTKAYWRYEADPSAVLFLNGNNFGVAKEWFERGGGYHEDLWPGYEDRELCDRLVRNGYRLIYAPEAVVAHNRTLTLGSFLTQHVKYGHGAFKYYRQYQGTAKRGERLFFFRAMRDAAEESRGINKLWAPFLVILSQIAVLSGVTRAAVTSRAARRN